MLEEKLRAIHEKAIERNITITTIIIKKILKRLNIDISGKENEIGVYVNAFINNKHNSSILHFINKLSVNKEEKDDQSLIQDYIRQINVKDINKDKISKIENIKDYSKVITALKSSNNYNNLDANLKFDMTEHTKVKKDESQGKTCPILQENYNLYILHKKEYDNNVFSDIFPAILCVINHFTKLSVSENSLKEYTKHLIKQLNVNVLSIAYDDLLICSELKNIKDLAFYVSSLELQCFMNMKNLLFPLDNVYYKNARDKIINENNAKYKNLSVEDKKFINNADYNNLLLVLEDNIQPEKTWTEWFLGLVSSPGIIASLLLSFFAVDFYRKVNEAIAYKDRDSSFRKKVERGRDKIVTIIAITATITALVSLYKHQTDDKKLDKIKVIDINAISGLLLVS